MKRREFIALFGGAAAFPFAARAEQRERMRHIGVLLPFASDDTQAQARVGVFHQELALLGWSIGGNVQTDIRWATTDTDIRRYAAELAALGPDVILANGASAVGSLKQATQTVPIVFVAITDPVGARIVDSLARPSGTVTGFMLFDFSLSGKWLELLKQLARRVTRAAALGSPGSPGADGQLKMLQAAAPAFGIELQTIGMHEHTQLESNIADFARQSAGGLVVTSSSATLTQREQIVALASKYRLPAVYADRVFVTAGGLAAYGPDRVDQYRQAARYVDRILKGEKPADLPVQAPTKYELVINLKTARSIALDVPPTLLALADEVIE